MIRTALLWILAVFYLWAGVAHLWSPDFFLIITPPWVPWPEAVIFWTGIAEIAGAIGLVQPFSKPLRRAAAIGLAAYAVCVFPANIYHFMLDMARADGGAGLAYHIPRMIAQPIIIWLALWTGEVLD